MPAKERPCLEHMQQLDRRVGQPLAHVLSLDFYWWQFNLEESVHPRNGNHAYLICCPKVPYAAYMLSMVFESCRPKSPGADMPSGWKPCLEHMQRCPGLLVAFSLSLVSFKRVNFQGTWRGFCSLEVVLPGGMNMASCLISMVFEGCWPESPGVNVLARERPCLEHVLWVGHRHT